MSIRLEGYVHDLIVQMPRHRVPVASNQAVLLAFEPEQDIRV